MSKHMTIINLACTITKLRKWGEAWKHSAESAQAATAQMHQANKDLERAKVITDGVAKRLVAERDAALTERDTQAANHEAKMVEHRAAFGARTEADAKIIEGLRADLAKERTEHQATADAAKSQFEADVLESARNTAKTLGHQKGETLLQAAQRVVKERDALRAEVADLRGTFDMVHEALGIKPGDHIGQAIDALKSEVGRLRGLKPELPPYPGNGKGLPRYGLRWNGPNEPLAVPMDDGYWTPYHFVKDERDQLRAELDATTETLRQAEAARNECAKDLRAAKRAYGDYKVMWVNAANEVRHLKEERDSLRAKLAAKTIEWPEWAKVGQRVRVRSTRCAVTQCNFVEGEEFVVAKADELEWSLMSKRQFWAHITDLEPVAEHVTPAVIPGGAS